MIDGALRVSLNAPGSGDPFLAGPGEHDSCILTETRTEDRYRCVLYAKREITVRSAVFTVERHADREDRIFANGYQSWTDTKEFLPSERLRDVTKIPGKLVHAFAFDRYGDAWFRKYRRNCIHGYDVGYIKGKNPFFAGNLNTENAYLIIGVDRSGTVIFESDLAGTVVPAGEELVLFDMILSEDIRSGKETYFRNFRARPARKLFGYTSWYNDYQDISEEKLLRNLASLDDRFDLFQIDDGFETHVGDWLSIDEKKFPSGLAPIVQKIHERSMLAGIWLAPFAAEENSAVFREHPDWVLRENGVPVKWGSNWSGFYCLDPDHEQVRAYLKRCLAFYLDLGFDFFKLDFLYCVTGGTGQGTRAQKARRAYRFLREELGDKLILGCGAILSSAAGMFDYMRVGPDISLSFDDKFYMRLLHRERVSTKVTLQNTIYRSIFDGHWFQNDPDVFLLRDENISLSGKQKEAVAKINALFGGILMTSDPIDTYDRGKYALLDEVFQLFREGKVSSFRRKGEFLRVDYRIGEEKKFFVYDTKKGVLV